MVLIRASNQQLMLGARGRHPPRAAAATTTALPCWHFEADLVGHDGMAIVRILRTIDRHYQSHVLLLNIGGHHIHLVTLRMQMGILLG